MKKLKSILILIPVLAGMILGSCDGGSGSKSHYRVVPADPTFFVILNLETLLQKSGVVDKLFPLAEARVGEDLAGKEFLALLKDRKKTGIDLDDVLIFDAKMARGGIVARVNDRSRFEQTLQLLASQFPLPAITLQDGYHEIADENFALLFNDDMAFLLLNNSLARKGMVESARELLSQPESQSILSNKKAMETIDPGNELSFYVDMSSINDLVPGVIPMIKMSTGIDFSRMSGAFGLAFPDGVIQFTAHILSMDPALVASTKEINHPLTCSQLPYFPSSTIMLHVSNVDGAASARHIEKSIEQFTSLAAMGGVPFPAELVNILPDVSTAFSSIKGEMTLGIIPGTPFPAALLYADVKDKRVQEILGKYLSAEYIPLVSNVVELEPDSYRVDFALLPFSVYHGVKNGRLVITTDKESYENAGQEVADPFSKSARAGNVVAGKTTGYFMFNIAAVMQPVALLSSMMNGQLNSSAMDLLNKFSYLELYTDDSMSGTLRVELQDKKQNALKLFTDLVPVD